ncbi:MAG TPA: nuclear transport factor 2 family protein [Acetobacteraceae bacterium]|nr:nuclear transport factor 2 family protein [Acetobacteraceae bacterium]
MSDEENESLKVVKTMAANGILGRWDIVKQYVSDDLVMHLPPGLPFGGDYLGWEGYLQTFKELGAFFTDLKSGEQEFACHGNKVIVMASLHGRIAKTGKPISFPITAIWTVEDGKVVDIVPFYYDTKTICDLAAE